MNVGTQQLTKATSDSSLLMEKPTEAPTPKPAALSIALDALCVLILLTVLGASFSKTIFAGQSVSRLALTAEWDALFHAFRTGNSALYDPSLIQLFGPHYFLVGKFLQQGFLPLWNPYNGFGCPLVADIQAHVFSPLRIFFNLAPSLQAWNYILIGELVLCAVSTFVLARYLKLGRIPALLSAALFTFCPYTMWYLELNIGTATCIFPLTFFLFARAARLRTKASSILAGLGCALLILCGHPESAFFGIAMGSFLMMCLMLLDPTLTSGQISRLLNFRRGLTLIGFTTVAITAPALFPFAEYLLNSDTYKYVSVSSAHVPWPGVIQHCLNPSSGAASPYLGIIAAICLPLAVFAFRKKSTYRTEVVSVLITAVVGFLLVTQLGQLEPLFSQPPLTTIVTRYCLPVLLLTLSLLAGFGLSELFSLNVDSKDSKVDETAAEPPPVSQKTGLFSSIPKKISTLAIAILFSIALPWLLRDFGDWMKACTYDIMLPAPAFNAVAWKRDAVCALVVLALAVIGWIMRKRIPGSVFAMLVLIPAFVSVASVSKASLPQQQTFNYPEVPPLTSLRDPKFRCLATGNHLFRPSVNAVYEVPDVGVHNPMFPKRYMAFIKECGANVDLFNQYFDTAINSPLLAVGSAKYVLSQLPVNRAGGAMPSTTDLVSTDKPIVFNNEVALERLAFWSAGTAGGGTMTWRVSADAAPRYSYALVLFDSKQQVLWFGDQKKLPLPGTNKGIEAFSIPVGADKVKSNEELVLGIQLYDRTNNRFVTPSTGAKLDTTVVLSRFQPSSSSATDGYSLPLLAEYPNHVRLYEIPGALPRAYVVHSAKTVKTEAEALAYIQSPQFHPGEEVVLEGETGANAVAPAPLPSSKINEAGIEQKGPNEVVTRFNAAAPGFLVLNDVFYPGWKAFLDGKETAIVRANHLFRAVQVPEGQHTVQFRYEPLSLFVGLAVSLLFLSGVTIAAVKHAITKKR